MLSMMMMMMMMMMIMLLQQATHLITTLRQSKAQHDEIMSSVRSAMLLHDVTMLSTALDRASSLGIVGKVCK